MEEAIRQVDRVKYRSRVTQNSQYGDRKRQIHRQMLDTHHRIKLNRIKMMQQHTEWVK